VIENNKTIDVTAAILVQDGKLFIAQRPANDPLAKKWELPGGKVRPGETPEECLQREIYEEFGMAITVQELFAENTHNYDHISIRLIAYIVRWEGKEIKTYAHDAISWASEEDIDSYDFAPADIPLINEIRRKNLVF